MPSYIESFTTCEEDALAAAFLSQGYVIADVEDARTIDTIRERTVAFACAHLGIDPPSRPDAFLNRVHERLGVEKLNAFRLDIYNKLNALPWMRSTYFSLARRTLESLVGNELAMQNRVNLSIQFPNDTSSLLGIHSDAFSGETPFQLVQWTPLVDVAGTKSMFILPPAANKKFFPDLKAIMESGGSDAVYRHVESHLVWIEIPYGKVLLFCPNVLHGNIVNSTSETRWSFNCRFTGLFTPYMTEEKNLGNFYLPITPRVVSRIGMAYRPPAGFGQADE
jgi:sporadic carbohydrate cluster 2OG-Fe(II) oxygenase